MALRGSDGTDSQWAGTLKPASAARANARSSSRAAAAYITGEILDVAAGAYTRT